MTTIAEWYARVNSAWPKDVPQLTLQEAERAIRKLYRFSFGKKAPYEQYIETRGKHRYNRSAFRAGKRVFLVNLGGHHRGGGWDSLLHDLSHRWHSGKPHSRQHARLELRLRAEVLKRGWLAGSLKSEEPPAVLPTPQDRFRGNIELISAKLARWQTKWRRAETAIKKLTRQRRYYERRLGVKPSTASVSKPVDT